MDEKTIKGMHKPDLLALIEETLGDINKIRETLVNIDEQKTQVSNINLEISEDKKNTEEVLGRINEMQTEAEKKLRLIQEMHAELYGNDEEDGDDGIKGELDNLLKDFTTTQKRIKTAENELYGYEEKNDEGEEKHVEGLTEKIKNFYKIQQKKFQDTHDKIEDELLAGATTVGLSKAYSDKVDSYKNSIIFWLIIFFISIIFIILFLFNLYFGWLGNSIEESILNSKSEISIPTIVFRFAINIGIISSLIWIATFSGKRYNQNKRLSEEYSYKATFAKSFEGYRKKAEELDRVNENRELSEALMNNMIEMSAFNPVNTMESKSHNENHPSIKILEKAMVAIEKSAAAVEKTANIFDDLKK